jgi:hypothetical protein
VDFSKSMAQFYGSWAGAKIGFDELQTAFEK